MSAAGGTWSPASRRKTQEGLGRAGGMQGEECGHPMKTAGLRGWASNSKRIGLCPGLRCLHPGDRPHLSFCPSKMGAGTVSSLRVCICLCLLQIRAPRRAPARRTGPGPRKL